MKKSLLLIVAFLSFSAATFAQGCVVNPIYEGADAGVYPLPDTTGGVSDELGVNEPACKDRFFDFTWTAVVPDSLEILGTSLDLDSIVIQKTGGIFDGPAGVDEYVCNPPSCVFEDNTEGCVKLYGIPTVEGPREDSLKIEAVVYFNSTIIMQYPITFPSEIIAPGHYIVYTLAPTDSLCMHTANREETSNFSSVQNNPNPFTAVTSIVFNSKVSTDVDFKVYNVIGKEVYANTQRAYAGENIFEFDGSGLNPGVYFYTIGNGNDAITKRMVINK